MRISEHIRLVFKLFDRLVKRSELTTMMDHHS